MSGQQTSKLLLDEEPLQVLPTLAVKLGLNRAMFVQQLHYWIRKPKAHVRGDEGGVERRWVYNTFEGWHEQFPFWTPEAIRKIVTPLVRRGIVLATDRFNERKGDRTRWYSIDYEVLNQLLGEEEEAPEDSPQPQEHPDKSTEQPENRPHLEPDKSTERYQRVPETNNRDSVLQTGEAQAPSPPKASKSKGQKGVSYRHYAFTRYRETENEVEALGWKPDPLPESSVKDYAVFYERAAQKGYALEELDKAVLWQFAKASGLIPNEPQAWCSFGTALRAYQEKPIPRSATRDPEARPEELRPHDDEYKSMVEGWLGETA